MSNAALIGTFFWFALFVSSPEEKRETVQQIRVKIKDIMAKAKDIDNISTQHV